MPPVSRDARSWIDGYAAALGLASLCQDDVDALLELAGVSAHASERIAAPLSCWLAARAGLTPAEALARARLLAESSPRAKVLTVSGPVASGSRPDEAGDAVAAALEGHGFVVTERRAVAGEVAQLAEALSELSSSFEGVLVTAGGTGFSPTDVTPEATRQVVEREAPGLAEATRAAQPLGRLCRGIAGTSGSCLIINLPGSATAATASLLGVIDVLGHALELLAGGRPH